jgi:uncharacterized protein (TIGR02147 family)
MNTNPSKKTKPVNIYSYDDYRLYLKDRYDSIVADDPSLSCRKFAKIAGFSNPGFLNDVIKGRRKLSRHAVEQIISAFKLSLVEGEFFRLIVRYGRLKKDDERQELYKKIILRRNHSSFVRLNPALGKYYQDYRYPLVRTALMAMDFRGDYNALASFIHPPLAPSNLAKYVEDLCAWNLVERKSNGRYVVTEKFIEPSSTLSEQVRQINREWIVQSIDALNKLPTEKRHISTMLLSISVETCKEIASRIEQFRDEIWKMVEKDAHEPSCIMQFNVQYFPRSKKGELR